MARRRIDVVLVDEEDLSRRGFTAALNEEPDIRVVADTGSAVDAVPLVERYRPDVVLTDVGAPGAEAVELTRRLTCARTAPAVMLLTSAGREDVLFSALRAGASGFLLKKTSLPELSQAIRAVAAGQAVICPPMTRLLLDRLGTLPVARRASTEAWSRLSARELDVLRALAGGRSNQEIAQELHLSVATVKSHISNLLGKLELRNRVEAALFVYQNSLS
ncbi:response regulator transcription factor [Saccharothrix xinjiangensis]|uniref:LuxR C-terminal-related transcriptional regulator n=1 Tax=Saccharothrix xinjiangensis TaxID=204798 RepID=A0ABV9Y3Q9_9PSEU